MELESQWAELDVESYKPVALRLAKLHRNAEPSAALNKIFKLKQNSNVFAVVSQFTERETPHSTKIEKISLLSAIAGVTVMVLAGLSIIAVPTFIIILLSVTLFLNEFEDKYRIKSKLKSEINKLHGLIDDSESSRAISSAPFSANSLVYFYVDGVQRDIDFRKLAESFSDFYLNSLGGDRSDLLFPEVFRAQTLLDPLGEDLSNIETETSIPEKKSSGFSERDPQVSKTVFELPPTSTGRNSPLGFSKSNSL